jgi:predicted acyltransferase
MPGKGRVSEYRQTVTVNAMLDAAASTNSSISTTTPVTPPRRIRSVDALRGFDMFFLMQEDPALISAVWIALRLPFRDVVAKQLDHTPWIGFTFWDFIAPLFLFIVGLALPLALRRRIDRGESRSVVLNHAFRRTIVLIVLGLVFNGILRLHLADFRYTGVLQRIALSYFFAALITVLASIRWQIIWTAILLVSYWLMMVLIPVPGFGAGVLTPQGNLEGYIDRLFLPGRFCCFVYGDNEGYLSTIPSIATVMLGVLCGHLILSGLSDGKKLAYLLGGGVASVLAGLVWSPFFPIITRLWTSSYTLLCNGLSMMLFALFWWIIDMRGYRKWAFPFIVIGLNALTIYVVQNLFDFHHVSDIVFGGLISYISGPWKLVMIAASIVFAKWLFLFFLYRQKIFLKT